MNKRATLFAGVLAGLAAIIASVMLLSAGAPSAPGSSVRPAFHPQRYVSVCDSSRRAPFVAIRRAGHVRLRAARSQKGCFAHHFALIGAPTVGEVLSTTNGTWNNTPTSFSYQWKDCNTSGANCVSITGATGATYTVASNDVGSTIAVFVTACNASGCSTAQKSNASGVVTGAAIPVHTETWAYDDCGNGGVGATSTLVRLWLTYAEANCGPSGNTKTLSDCHAGATIYCQVTQYLDTNWIFYTAPNNSPQWSSFNAAASETWYLHNPGSTTVRIGQAGFGGGYLQDQNTAGVQSFYQSYVRTNYANVDGLFMDDQSPNLSSQLFYSNTCGGGACATTNEITTDVGLRAEHAAMAAALTRTGGATTYPQDANTIQDCGNSNLAQGVGPSNMVSGATVNLIAEGCPEVNGTLTTKYAGFLDDVAYVENSTSGAVTFLSYGASGAGYQGQSRLVQEATDLLGYKANQFVAWSDLETGNNALAVWPESGIYPTGAFQTMGNPSGTGCFAVTGVYCPTGGHNDVQTATAGVYRREFANCYDQGTTFGKCAAIMNTTGAPVTVSSGMLPNGPYTHSITLSGGDVQSGGTINLTGAAFTVNSTTVGADSALILTP